jgi:hypothetical protein
VTVSRVLAAGAIAYVLFTAGQIDAGAAAAPLLAVVAAVMILAILVVIARRQARP